MACSQLIGENRIQISNAQKIAPPITISNTFKLFPQHQNAVQPGAIIPHPGTDENYDSGRLRNQHIVNQV